MTEDNLGASELTVGSGIIENHKGRATRGCKKESKEDGWKPWKDWPQTTPLQSQELKN